VPVKKSIRTHAAVEPATATSLSVWHQPVARGIAGATVADLAVRATLMCSPSSRGCATKLSGLVRRF